MKIHSLKIENNYNYYEANNLLCIINIVLSVSPFGTIVVSRTRRGGNGGVKQCGAVYCSNVINENKQKCVLKGLLFGGKSAVIHAELLERKVWYFEWRKMVQKG